MTPLEIRRTAALLVVAALGTLAAPPIRACQKPPDQYVECRVIPRLPVVKLGDPIDFDFTLVNSPKGPKFPPPFLDDAEFLVQLYSGPLGGGACALGGDGLPAPASYNVRLDQAWSPYANEPTSDTRRITVTPASPSGSYNLEATASGFFGGGPWCRAQACVEAVADPAARPVPYALFLDPAQGGDAGEPLRFDLRVLRNGYPKGRPLTVRVLPENTSDPLDIFPLTPPGLSTTGYVVTGDDELVRTQCTLHFPCFVGVDNLYHVTIHDGTTLLWDSRVTSPGGIARALVSRSRIPRQELIEIRDDSADGRLVPGEHGFIHLRLYARNPFFAIPLDAVRIVTPLPTGLTVKSASLHFHDNPMDSTTPTPAELAATGTIATPPGAFQVDVAQIIARFSAPPFDPPPTVFRDLFEIDLELETPAAGFPTERDLVFPGLNVSGQASTTSHIETSAPLTVRVASLRPPRPVPALFAVKQTPADVRFAWDDSPSDPQHSVATSYAIYRSVTTAASGYSKLLDAPNTPATSESAIDPGAISPAAPGSTLHHYRAVAMNLDGNSGDIP